MGERWTTIRDDLLARGDGDYVALLQQELYRLGHILDPRLAGFDHETHPFPNLHDAATVSLLQAAELTHHRELIAVMLRSAQVVSSNASPKDGILAVAELASMLERLFRHLALAASPQLDRKITLTQSLLALREAEILPLSRAEQEAWTADEDWVRGERAQQRSDKGRKGVPDSKAIPRLWENRVGRRLRDPYFAEECPRYFAVLELQRLRNAFSHQHSSELRQLGFAHLTWGRVVGLATMTCMRAFAAGVLVPSPTPQRDASTILRPPDRTEALIAVASLVEPASEPDEPRRSEGFRRFLWVTAAATVAVVAGTLAGNLLSPKTVSTATTEGREAVAGDPDLSMVGEPPMAPAPQPQGSRAPPVAMGLASHPPPLPKPQTKRCQGAREINTGTLPHLRLTEGRRPLRVLPADELARRLRSGNGVQPIVWLATDDPLEQRLLLAALETEICAGHPVLSLDEALDSSFQTSERSFVVAVSPLGDAPDMKSISRLVRGGTRVLIAGGDPPGRAEGITVVRPTPLNCVQAEAALYGALGRDPGADELRFRRWALFPPGGGDCDPGSLLNTLAGVQVVAATLARHERRPDTLDGSWTSWVAASTQPPARRTPGAGTPLPKAPEAERELRQAALNLDRAVDPRGPNPKRRKACERWSEDLFVGPTPPSPGVVTHLLGLESGQRCAAWLLAGLDAQGASAQEIGEVVNRGLGTHDDRAVTLKRLVGDQVPARLSRDVRTVVEGLQ